jgi:hypothetical protein
MAIIEKEFLKSLSIYRIPLAEAKAIPKGP